MKDVLFITVCLTLAGCSWLNEKLGIEDDGLVEESVEAVIEHHTGLDIDLTPSSKEG